MWSNKEALITPNKKDGFILQKKTLPQTHFQRYFSRITRVLLLGFICFVFYVGSQTMYKVQVKEQDFFSPMLEQIVPDSRNWRTQVRRIHLSYLRWSQKKPMVILLTGKDDRQSSESIKKLQQGLQLQMKFECVKRIMAKDIYVMDPIGLEAYNVETYDDLLLHKVYRLVSSCQQNCILMIENFQYLHVMVLPIFVDILQGIQRDIYTKLNKHMIIILSTSRGMVDDVLYDKLNGDDVALYQKLTQRWLQSKDYSMWQKDQQALNSYVEDIDIWSYPNQLNRYRNINYIVDYQQILAPLLRCIDFMLPVAASKANVRIQQNLHYQIQEDQMFKQMRNHTYEQLQQQKKQY